MKLNTLFLSAGCMACWIVFFPIVVIGGGVALFLVAVGTELSHLMTGTAGKAIDPSTAHEMAMRICFGHRTPARASRRNLR